MAVLQAIGWTLVMLVTAGFALMGALVVVAFLGTLVLLFVQGFCEIAVDFWRWARNPRRHWF